MLLNRRGFGLIEVMLSIVVLSILGISIGKLMTVSRTRSLSVYDHGSCQEIATNIVNSVTNMNNALIVRNFLPTQALPRAPRNDQDPFCNGGEDLCDSADMLSQSPGIAPEGANSSPNQKLGEYVHTEGGLRTVHRNYLNVRGASTWTQLVYNSQKPLICGAGGLTFTAGQAIAFLPSPVKIPRWVSSVQFHVSQP
ncbi:MAG: prepilin-type N-terminal cleavage/methylation domain-containing protein, partial [Bdellovibrionia bacterium]